ncbi:MAG: hypothetical protein ABSG00_05450 [Terracidiphilus sp.]
MPNANVCATGANLYPNNKMLKPIQVLTPGTAVITRGPWHPGVHVPVELTNPRGFVYGDLID